MAGKVERVPRVYKQKCIETFACIEQRKIVIGIVDNGVITIPADKHVDTGASIEPVIATATYQFVSPRPAIQVVIAKRPDQLVIACVTGQNVVQVITGEDVVA